MCVQHWMCDSVCIWKYIPSYWILYLLFCVCVCHVFIGSYDIQVNLSISNLILHIVFVCVWEKARESERLYCVNVMFLIWIIFRAVLDSCFEKIVLSYVSSPGGGMWKCNKGTILGLSINQKVTYTTKTHNMTLEPRKLWIWLIDPLNFLSGTCLVVGHLNPAFLMISLFSRWYIEQQPQLLCRLSCMLFSVLYKRNYVQMTNNRPILLSFFLLEAASVILKN